MRMEEFMKNVVPENYVFEDQAVHSLGVLTLNPFAKPTFLKTYERMKGQPPEPVDSKLKMDLKQYLENQILEKKINPRYNVGFMMLSDKFLNVDFWGDTNVIYPNLYVMEGDESPKAWKKVPIEDYGSECIWEGKIKSHEINAWADFLRSQRTKDDLKHYLHSYIDEEQLFGNDTITIEKSAYDELINAQKRLNRLQSIETSAKQEGNSTASKS